jgi:hypothetical protein
VDIVAADTPQHHRLPVHEEPVSDTLDPAEANGSFNRFARISHLQLDEQLVKIWMLCIPSLHMRYADLLELQCGAGPNRLCEAQWNKSTSGIAQGERN